MPSNYQGRTGVLLFEQLGILLVWATNLKLFFERPISVQIYAAWEKMLFHQISYFHTKQDKLPVDLTGIMIEVSSWWIKSLREILRLD